MVQEIRLGAVQLTLRSSLFQDEESFYQGLTRPLKDLKGKEETLLVYPEDVGLFTLLFHRGHLLEDLSTLEEALKTMIKGNFFQISWKKVLQRVSFTRALLLSHQKEMASRYFHAFSTVAKEYRAYVVAGSIPLTLKTLSQYLEGVKGDKGELYNTSILFGPKGEILGYQRKVHLTEIEGPLGLDLSPAPLHHLKVIPTPLGAVGIVICYDAFHNDVLKKMLLGGTEILVQPTANPKPWEAWQQEEWLLGMEMAMRNYPFIYGINPMLNGEILDLPFAGQSTILATPPLRERLCKRPLGYQKTETQETFLAVMDDPKGEGLLEVLVPHPSTIGPL